MSYDDPRAWTILINSDAVVVRVQEPAPEPAEVFDVLFEVIDVKAENVTQFTVTPEQWIEIRELVDGIIHKRMA
jgi:hypothetical protein